MLYFLRKLLCIHKWEYEKDINDDDIKVCRYCDKTKVL